MDATVLLGDVSTEALVAALEDEGFELRINDPAFVAATRVIPVVHRPTGLPADIVLGGPGLEELFLSRASRRSVGGTQIPVVSAEDLIVMKILAGRDKDKEDVRAVVRAGQATLKLDTIRATINQPQLLRADLLVLYMIRDAYPDRPVYFSRTSGGYGQELGLQGHLLTQELDDDRPG